MCMLVKDSQQVGLTKKRFRADSTATQKEPRSQEGTLVSRDFSYLADKGIMRVNG